MDRPERPDWPVDNEELELVERERVSTWERIDESSRA